MRRERPDARQQIWRRCASSLWIYLSMISHVTGVSNPFSTKSRLRINKSRLPFFQEVSSFKFFHWNIFREAEAWLDVNVIAAHSKEKVNICLRYWRVQTTHTILYIWVRRTQCRCKKLAIPGGIRWVFSPTFKTLVNIFLWQFPES